MGLPSGNCSCCYGNVSWAALKGDFIPDKDDFDFRRRAFNYRGCILVAVAVKDLPINLKEMEIHGKNTKYM